MYIYNCIDLFFSAIFIQLQIIVTNLTTNEKANYTRYHHFKTMDGKYLNPFDRGVLLNCLEYFYVVDPPHIAKRKVQAHVV